MSVLDLSTKFGEKLGETAYKTGKELGNNIADKGKHLGQGIVNRANPGTPLNKHYLNKDLNLGLYVEDVTQNPEELDEVESFFIKSNESLSKGIPPSTTQYAPKEMVQGVPTTTDGEKPKKITKRKKTIRRLAQSLEEQKRKNEPNVFTKFGNQIANFQHSFIQEKNAIQFLNAHYTVQKEQEHVRKMIVKDSLNTGEELDESSWSYFKLKRICARTDYRLGIRELIIALFRLHEEVILGKQAMLIGLNPTADILKRITEEDPSLDIDFALDLKQIMEDEKDDEDIPSVYALMYVLYKLICPQFDPETNEKLNPVLDYTRIKQIFYYDIPEQNVKKMFAHFKRNDVSIDYGLNPGQNPNPPKKPKTVDQFINAKKIERQSKKIREAKEKRQKTMRNKGWRGGRKSRKRSSKNRSNKRQKQQKK